MKKVLIFAGTTEGRRLAEILAASGILCEISVATEYGKEQMLPHELCRVHTGRKDAAGMLQWMQEEKFAAVVDATHPFATEVSTNIRQSAGQAKVPCLRLRRATDRKTKTGGNDIIYVADAAECKARLEQTEGNILLTTGSKELHMYASESLRKRIFVRVLPAVESIGLCREQGIAGERIIAMQGPFSVELNKALLRQYHIAVLVTKESGVQGGYSEKIEAARASGVKVIVIKNPEKESAGKEKNTICYSMEDALGKLEKLLGKPIVMPQKKKHIWMIGVGMGNRETLTVEALDTIRSAHMIFGAKRMLAASYVQENKHAKKYPYYLCSNILPCLKEMRDGDTAVVLFSGDSGFYSGAGNMLKDISDAMGEQAAVEIHVLPGISSLSYLAAKAGISWQDAKILSIHGKNESVLPVILKEKKVFLLTSDAEDMRRLGYLLEERQLADCRLIVGYQLSYPEEEILYLTPKQCKSLEKQGLYCCFILKEKNNPAWGLTPGFSDAMFLRDKVPMTKEEVREVSLCKLHLTKDAVLYDVGSGTGSIAVEAAFLSETICVYAIEKKWRAIELIRQNCEKFALSNVKTIEGKAPEILSDLPAPTHVFIGGSGGYLFPILQMIAQKSRNVRVVINAVSLETVAQLQRLQQEISVEHMEMVQLQVSRSREIGNYHLMQAENPVYICSFDMHFSS